MEGFFAPLQAKIGPRKADVTPDDYRRVDQLRAAVKHHTKASSDSLRKTDVVEFGILRRRVSDEDKIDATLDWYCRHISDKWTPKAFTGAAFRAKFPSIHAAMLRSADRKEDVCLGDDAMRLAERITSFVIWPLGSASQVPQLVSRALANVQRFQRILSNLAQHGADSPLTREYGIAADRLLKLMGPPDFVVEFWFSEVAERVSRWDGWSGRLDYFMWDVDHPEVVGPLRAGLGWAESMYDSQWNDLVNCVRGWS